MNKEAYNYSISLLSKRDYSSHKLKQKLYSRKYTSDEAQLVLDKLIEQNYLREDLYINSRVEALLTKGFSNHYIVQKLNQEELDIDNQLINQIKLELGICDDKQMSSLILKKLRNKVIPSDKLERDKLRMKLINFLSSKGYDYSSSEGLISKVLESSSPQ